MCVALYSNTHAALLPAAGRSKQHSARAAVATPNHQPMFHQQRTAAVCRAGSTSLLQPARTTSIRRQQLLATPVAPCSHRQKQQQQGPTQRRVSGICRVLTESAQLEIGSQAPAFELPEPLTGKSVSLAAASAGAKATLVMFICNHCPFVVMLKGAIAELSKEYQAKGLAVVAISSNSNQTHPQDGPGKMAEDATANGYTFPYLFDESQAVAKAYKAACTPEFYVFDAELKLTYHGQFDDARPNNGKPVTGADLRVALDAALAGSGLPAEFKPRPSIGCNIKWHPGQEPDYYGSQIVQK